MMMTIIKITEQNPPPDLAETYPSSRLRDANVHVTYIPRLD